MPDVKPDPRPPLTDLGPLDLAFTGLAVTPSLFETAWATRAYTEILNSSQVEPKFKGRAPLAICKSLHTYPSPA